MNTSGVIRYQKISEGKRDLARLFRKSPTEAEDILWQALRRHQVLNLHFRRQQVIDGYIADFYCEKSRLVIEVDGGIHNEPTQVGYDAHRTEILKRRKISVLRFTNNEVLGNIQSVIESIKEFAFGKNIASPPGHAGT